jgi:hypothetical protein
MGPQRLASPPHETLSRFAGSTTLSKKFITDVKWLGTERCLSALRAQLGCEVAVWSIGKGTRLLMLAARRAN